MNGILLLDQDWRVFCILGSDLSRALLLASLLLLHRRNSCLENPSGVDKCLVLLESPRIKLCSAHI